MKMRLIPHIPAPPPAKVEVKEPEVTEPEVKEEEEVINPEIQKTDEKLEN